MLVTNMKNKYDHASKMLQKKRDRLISGFLNRRDPFFLENHARILDDYFREIFERSEVGPMMGINKNPYAIFATGGSDKEGDCRSVAGKGIISFVLEESRSYKLPRGSWARLMFDDKSSPKGR